MKHSYFKRKITKSLKRSYFKKKVKVKNKKQKNPLKLLKDELWELCKQLTRKFFGYSCYTCDDYVEFPHTGHFITDSICSTELSYDLKNLRPQCYRCNIHLSGNWVEFERRLIEDCGEKYVNELKERNNLTKRTGLDSKGIKYDEFWYKSKIEEYRNLLNKI